MANESALTREDAAAGPSAPRNSGNTTTGARRVVDRELRNKRSKLFHDPTIVKVARLDENHEAVIGQHHPKPVGLRCVACDFIVKDPQLKATKFARHVLVCDKPCLA